MDKAKRYNWVKSGDSGYFTYCHVDELKIDHSYQRKIISDKTVLEIARNFNTISFGAIIVMVRSNGEKYVVDGQHRLLGAMRREDIKQIPCIMYLSDGPQHEAIAFVSLNTSRVNVSSVDKFNAKVMANKEPEINIYEWLKGIGLTVHHNVSEHHLCFPTVLITTWKISIVSCKNAIIAQKLIVGSEELHGDIHKGLFWLFNNGIKVDDMYITKIIRMGGKQAILKNINMTTLEIGAQKSIRICGISILRMMNYKNKNKIPVPDNE